MIFNLVGEQRASRIASQASIEESNTYADNISFYQEQNYSYIPIPTAGQFYHIDQNQLKEMASDQILPDDAHLVVVMAHLREYPFILLDDHGLLSDQSDLAESFGLDRSAQDRYDIVTVADLNKRRVKEMLYPAVATFEHTLADLVIQYYPDSDVPEDDVKEDAFDRWDRAKEGDMETHITEYMSLGDIVTVVRNTEALRTTCDFDSKTQYDNAIGGLVDLRNKVMHPRRILIPDPSHVQKTIERLGRINSLCETLKSFSKN
ncbi:hypothetical protein [Halorubrum sp. FL23]|uniref:hypothetical protein n=1 Tax=Halorubrum sp. FL23 TaxID=3458704 RepID=UPI0040333A0D